MPDASHIVELIDGHIARTQVAGDSDNTPRSHLGASVLGVDCDRERWYTYRWATKRDFEGRMLRLFDRGHKEEHRFVTWLRLIGCEVRQYAQRLMYHPESDAYFAAEWDTDTPDNAFCDDVTDLAFHRERAKALYGVELKQYGFKAYDGHFAGSSDGRARFVPGVEALGLPPDTWIGLEFKTHNAASFATLIAANNLEKGKREHYIQTCVYAHYMQLPLTLYMAVNKDTEHMYTEFVLPNPTLVEAFDPKIRQALYAKQHPTRISRSPSWHLCKFCDHKRTCHFGDPMQANCRTCMFSTPVDNGQWHCAKWGKRIPDKAAQLQGCAYHTMIQD